jgi:hypothetical protein
MFFRFEVSENFSYDDGAVEIPTKRCAVSASGSCANTKSTDTD